MAAKNQNPSKIIYDYTNMTSGAVGAKHGITDAELDRFAKKAAEAHERRAAERKAGKLPFMDLPYKKKEAAEIVKFAKTESGKYENLVVLGIGGSALGMIALQTALNPIFYNLSSGAVRKTPRLFVEDNVDPERIANLLEIINPKKTLFNVISKSGGTAETMSAFMIARELIAKKVGASAVKTQIVATTDARSGIMRKITDEEGFRSFDVPDGVGGRFSALTPVGLLPAAMVGIDIVGLLDGAAAMDRRCRAADIRKNPALLSAALQYLADVKKGKRIQVMMPYSNALKDVADWYRQLWAESLGKKYSLDGKVVHAGQTPVKALGATDQHSQVQLYNEGPNDKTITFLRVEKFRKDITIPKIYGSIGGISYLGGRKMSELINAEQLATGIAVTGFNRPNSTIILPEISANTVGQLLYMLEMQTAYAGLFYGIDAFDQPGVEAGKIATYALMGRPGFEKEAARINKAVGKVKKRTV